MSFFSSSCLGELALVCAASTLAVASGCSSADLSGNTGVGGQALGNSGAPATGGSLGTGGGASTGGSGATGAFSATGGSIATGSTGGASATTGGASTVSTPNWSQLYTKYFGPGTAGDCVASGCHSSGNSPSFNSATTMCSALKSYFGGTISFSSILTWMGPNGNMPLSGAAAPANAVADITAWQNAGAVCP